MRRRNLLLGCVLLMVVGSVLGILSHHSTFSTVLYVLVLVLAVPVGVQALRRS